MITNSSSVKTDFVFSVFLFVVKINSAHASIANHSKNPATFQGIPKTKPSQTQPVLFLFEVTLKCFWRTLFKCSLFLVLCGQICKIVVCISDPGCSHYACEVVLYQ